jgi:hypothetical protein
MKLAYVKKSASFTCVLCYRPCLSIISELSIARNGEGLNAWR